jgi:hypothetical protein
MDKKQTKLEVLSKKITFKDFSFSNISAIENLLKFTCFFKNILQLYRKELIIQKLSTLEHFFLS